MVIATGSTRRAGSWAARERVDMEIVGLDPPDFRTILEFHASAI